MALDGSKCFICGNQRQPVDLEWSTLGSKSIEEIDEIRYKIQPKEHYNQAAWLHREHMDITFYNTGSICPAGFDRTYQEGVVLPECPYCHGYYTKKIGAGSRLMSVGLFGLGSNKIGKQWHCCLCNSDF